MRMRREVDILVEDLSLSRRSGAVVASVQTGKSSGCQTITIPAARRRQTVPLRTNGVQTYEQG